ncbi:stress-induced protein YchH [Acerihabitans sp. TG2]|uniref:stress-induced protein YchH n=1 Tax=Acerihabitans sp. TG2 TaxID=3096008 RepID=UPI002B23218B|nr:stress-induced protein YchH [Acerihabitans sp. TG2]MEA9391043.1 stress-induced protein YchH [Acerihabitans sp. TG2]
MKRKSALFCGNGLMGLGMLMMIGGLACSVLNQLPQLNFSTLIAHGAIMGIFIGALLWVAGARMGGHEHISDRYWWHRRFDERCRRTGHH